jgi:hypothetical protein
MKSIAQVFGTFVFSRQVLMHEMFVESFGLSLNESVEDSNNKDVFLEIKSDSYTSDANDFHNSLTKSKHALMLTPYTISELKSMKLFKLEGHNIGFALKKKDGKFQELVAVHNNTDISGVGKELVKSAIRMGAKYLDHFDGFLTDFYEELGFKEISRDKYDPKYDEGGKFAKKYGEKDIIYRKLK